MTNQNHLNMIFYLLRFIMRKLRHELLTEPIIHHKIRLCELINDCAVSIDEIYNSNYWKSTSTETDNTFTGSFLAEIAQCSFKEDSNKIFYFLKEVDAQTKFIRSKNPKICNLVRRTIENISAFYIPFSVQKNIGTFSDLYFKPYSVNFLDLDTLPWPSIPSKPARDIAIYDNSREKKEDVQILTFLGDLHRQTYSIEIPAAEICSVIPLLFPDLPIELDICLARQAYDEGRHARLLIDYFLSQGGRIEDYKNDFQLWDKGVSGNTLVEFICIQHVLGEGYALGHGLKSIRDCQDNGMNELINIHTELYEDELMHVSDGLAWFNYLAKDAANDIISKLEESFAVTPPPDPYFAEDTRRLVGFSEEQIHRQRKFLLERASKRK